jgi:23S rRNA (guanine745-N1)-methyltransferase
VIAEIMPIDRVLDLLCCPTCAEALTRRDASVVCTAGHTFDLARQGYLNLLGRAAPANADTAEMVAARDRFLSRGWYAALAEGLLGMLRSHPAGPWVEVGAGTGYYLAYVLQGLGGRGVAVDVSRAASRRAARAHDQLGAVVADVWGRLPIRDATAEAVLCVFAPRNPAEFARILRPDGALVIISPMPDHLTELRGPLGLLDIEVDKQDRISRTLADLFTAVESVECRYRVSLDAASVIDLVSMGPNAFHHDHRRLAAQVAGLGPPIEVTVAVAISAWRPRHRP